MINMKMKNKKMSTPMQELITTNLLTKRNLKEITTSIKLLILSLSLEKEGSTLEYRSKEEISSILISK